MSNSVRISEKLINESKLYSKIENRSMSGQIEYWAKIGKLAEENPDLTFNLIKEILIGVCILFTFSQWDPKAFGLNVGVVFIFLHKI